MEDIEGNLGSVKELAASFGGDGADEDAVGGAGDEVADAFVAGKHRHGATVGRAPFLGLPGAN